MVLVQPYPDLLPLLYSHNPLCVASLYVTVHSPTVSDIQCTPTQPQWGKPVRLFCAINNFFPQYCSTRWYRGQEILPQSSVKEDQVEDPESGLFSRTTAVQYTPTVNDHGTEFCVEITHHKENIKKTFPMKLKGLPYIESITCNRDSPKVGEELTLQCKVTGANARNITAKWRAGSDPITGEMKTEINRDTVTFLLRLISTVEHYGKIFTCLIRHGDLQEPMERNITLKWADNPPTLSEIEVLPTNPEVHKEATFRITISGFSQKDHQVRWFLQGSQIPESLKKVCSDPKIDAPKEEEDAPKLIETSELQIGEDGLYVCSSTLRYTPTDKDNGTFIRCVFTAKGIISKKKYQLSLTGAEMKEPMIECVTLDPRKGEAVTLECIIRGVGVSHGIFSWSDGIFPIDEGLIDNSNLPDGSGCISRVTFTPDDGHIRFEATFNSGTIEKTYQLPWV
uniref:Ig-like domain-containing protein n=1 Tax=Xenopus tropicalis TaxID=8364 RepID=A0A1B8XUU1_XENTR